MLLDGSQQFHGRNRTRRDKVKNTHQLPPGDHDDRLIQVGERRAPAVWNPPVEYAHDVAAEGDDLQLVLEYLRLLWRHKWVLALFLIAGALTALAVSLLKTPLYGAQTALHIEEFQELLNPLQVGNPTLITQAELLRSRDLRQRALAMIAAQPPPAIPEVEEPLAGLRALFGMPEPLKEVPWEEAVGIAAAYFSVTEPERDNFIVTISTQSPNPRAAADFVNAMGQGFIDSRWEQREKAYARANTDLSAATHQLQSDWDDARRRLEAFARQNGLVITGETSLTQANLLQTQAALGEATTRRMQAEASFDARRESPEVLDSGLQAQIYAQQALLDSLLVNLTPANPRVRELQAQLDRLRTAQESERSRIVRVSEVELRAARQQEQELRQRYDALSRLFSDEGELRSTYTLLLDEVETAKTMYMNALARGTETTISSRMRPDGARLVDPALPSFRPQKPNLTFNLALGLFGGFSLGAGVVILRARSDTRVQGPGTLRPYLHVRELGVIPSAKSDPEVKALTRRSSGPDKRDSAVRSALLRAGGETRDPLESLELVTWTRKPSVFAEAFRSTMTSILYSGENGDRPRVLLVSSASPKEGKSTIASNLAIALAEINQRVLLIDGDLRLPRIHSIFDLPNTYGLSDVLHERTPIESYDEEGIVRKTPIPGLYILPAGPARASVTPLLHSPRMRELMTRFRDAFDVVLIDAAPVLSVPDARVLARISDAVILVLRAHSTTQESALEAARSFTEDGTRILGTILNDWDPNASGAHGYSAYYSAYQSPYHS